MPLRDSEIRKIFTGESDKFVVLVGPCSADNEDTVCEYANRLKNVADRVSDKLMIIPRVYTNKPRTTGDGYKGMLHQPEPDKAPDLLAGISAIRNMHLRVLAETGHFIYRGFDVATSGNELAHTILRGGVNKFGQTQPNYHYEELVRLAELYNQWNLKNPAVIVDVNHSNSGKQYKEQIRIVSEVLHSRNYNSDLKKLVKGVMIESYLLEGRQDISDHMIPGCSITDPCLGWEDTERLIYEIAEKC